jgi:hypothetical protein
MLVYQRVNGCMGFFKGAFMGIDVMLAGFYQTSSDLWDLK